MTKKNTIILGGIIIFALALRYTYFVGFNLSDDQFYIEIAHNLMHGNLGDHGVFANRTGMTYPLALTYILFGVGDYTTTLYPMICAIGSVVLAYLGGSLFYTPTIGLIAAFLLSFYPLHILYSSVFMPDIPIEFFGSAAIILFFCIYKEKLNKSWLYVSGLLMGYIYLINVRSVVCLIPLIPFLSAWLFKKKGLSLIALFMAGLLTVITIEGAYNYIRCKDPFVNYHESRQEFTLEHYKPANIDMWAYPRLMFGLDQNNNIITNHPRLMYGYFFFFAAIALFMCNRSMLIPVWWMLSVYLWMQFGSMSFTEYAPMHRLERHLSVITIPMVILVGSLIYRTGKRGAIIMAFLLFTSLYYINTLHEEYVLPGDDFKGIYEYVKEYPDRNIYADTTVLARIRYYSGFKKKEALLHDIFSTPFNKVLPDSFVVRDGSRGPVENPVQRRFIEEKFRAMPPTWRLEKTVVENPLGYYGLFDPKIYHVSK